jgi:hypothetical protein
VEIVVTMEEVALIEVAAFPFSLDICDDNAAGGSMHVTSMTKGR